MLDTSFELSLVKKSQSKKIPSKQYWMTFHRIPKDKLQTLVFIKPARRRIQSQGAVSRWFGGPVVWDSWDFLMKGMVRDCYERGNPLKTSQIYLNSSYWHHIIYAQKKTKKNHQWLTIVVT